MTLWWYAGSPSMETRQGVPDKFRCDRSWSTRRITTRRIDHSNHTNDATRAAECAYGELRITQQGTAGHAPGVSLYSSVAARSHQTDNR